MQSIMDTPDPIPPSSSIKTNYDHKLFLLNNAVDCTQQLIRNIDGSQTLTIQCNIPNTYSIE